MSAEDIASSAISGGWVITLASCFNELLPRSVLRNLAAVEGCIAMDRESAVRNCCCAAGLRYFRVGLSFESISPERLNFAKEETETSLEN